MSKIEYSNQGGKFTAAEIRTKIEASKRFWKSPAGKAEKRRLDAAKRKSIPTKFPSLAGKGTKPELINPLAARLRLLNR
jgi:hypothetical protein